MSSNLQEWTVLSMLEWATDYFQKKNVVEPRLSIEWLIADVLDIKRLDLYLKFDRPLAPDELDALRPLVKRRARHEPLQYILGFSDFVNARISVTPNVLIPRIETEQLVEIILNDYPDEAPLKVLDIGTGSGCIPIALKMERPQWIVSAIDVSPPALKVARDNADQNNVDITFMEADFTDMASLPVPDHTFDLIVCNPPYILPSEKDEINIQVKKNEPNLALFTENIQAVYQHVCKLATQKLTDGGYLYLELNAKHAQSIRNIFSNLNWKNTLLKDYENKLRFLKSQYRS